MKGPLTRSAVENKRAKTSKNNSGAKLAKRAGNRLPVQHGLSTPLLSSPGAKEGYERLARSIAKGRSSLFEQAEELVFWVLELLRVHAARATLLDREITDQETDKTCEFFDGGQSPEVSGAIAALPPAFSYRAL